MICQLKFPFPIFCVELSSCLIIAFDKNTTFSALAEIVMFEGLTCVYRSNIDLYFYVIGSSSENEVIDQIC